MNFFFVLEFDLWHFEKMLSCSFIYSFRHLEILHTESFYSVVACVPFLKIYS